MRYKNPYQRNVNTDLQAHNQWQWEINHGKRPQDDPLPETREDKVNELIFPEGATKIIKWYHKLWLWLLPTHYTYDFFDGGNITVHGKHYRGHIYITKIITEYHDVPF